MAFYDVVTGNTTNAADLNQLVDALNGTVVAQLTIKSTANNAQAVNFLLPSAPTADQAVARHYVSGDATARVATYIRSADGYGGLSAGAGSSTTAHLYANASGWVIAEALNVIGALTQNGVNTALQGTHSSGVPKLSFGSGVPSTLDVDEIYFQVS